MPLILLGIRLEGFVFQVSSRIRTLMLSHLKLQRLKLKISVLSVSGVGFEHFDRSGVCIGLGSTGSD